MIGTGASPHGGSLQFEDCECVVVEMGASEGYYDGYGVGLVRSLLRDALAAARPAEHPASEEWR